MVPSNRLYNFARPCKKDGFLNWSFMLTPDFMWKGMFF